MQPPADLFQLFDTLLLLSKGRVVFMGPANMAVSHFTETATLCFSSTGYFNPADFLLDISACQIKNMNVSQHACMLGSAAQRCVKVFIMQVLTVQNILFFFVFSQDQTVDAPTLELFFQNSSYYRNFDVADGDASESATSSYKSKNNKKALYGVEKTLLNPIIEREVSPSKDVHSSTSDSRSNPLALRPSRSFDVGDEDSVSHLPRESSVIARSITAVSEWWTDVRNTDFKRLRMLSALILTRAFFALVKREKLLIGSLILHFLLAMNFYWIMGDSSEDTNPVIGFFAVNALVLIVANVQWGFFLLKSNEVCYVRIFSALDLHFMLRCAGVSQGELKRSLFR